MAEKQYGLGFPALDDQTRWERWWRKTGQDSSQKSASEVEMIQIAVERSSVIARATQALVDLEATTEADLIQSAEKDDPRKQKFWTGFFTFIRKPKPPLDVEQLKLLFLPYLRQLNQGIEGTPIVLSLDVPDIEQAIGRVNQGL